MVWVKSEVILSVYIILMGLPANILALYAFSVKIHNKPTPTDILLLNLIVSNLLFLLFLPLKMYEAASGMLWNLPEFLCSITSYTFFSTIYTSSLLLMAVSVVRYLAVAYPIAYHKLHKPFYSVVASTIIWLLSTAHCSIVFIIQHHPDLSPSNTSVCYEDFTEQQLAILLPVRLEFFIMLCLVPLIVCIFCYLRCIWILYTLPRISPGQKQKAIGMALGTLSVFLVCVFPYNVSHVLVFFHRLQPLVEVLHPAAQRLQHLPGPYHLLLLLLCFPHHYQDGHLQDAGTATGSGCSPKGKHNSQYGPRVENVITLLQGAFWVVLSKITIHFTNCFNSIIKSKCSTSFKKTRFPISRGSIKKNNYTNSNSSDRIDCNRVNNVILNPP
uniref:Si:ch211-231m23.4 n=1 Tax=Oncorhynchus kisutch TaxID=8019 RepID=A0A8C7G1I3_ONCKI